MQKLFPENLGFFNQMHLQHKIEKFFIGKSDHFRLVVNDCCYFNKIMLKGRERGRLYLQYGQRDGKR